MIVYLCRHGARERDGAEREKPVRLTDEGRSQAERLARWLDGQNVHAIFSSPKVRAIETALPLSRLSGWPIYVWPLLIEHNSYGPLDYVEEEIVRLGGRIDRDMKLPDTPLYEERDFAYKRAMSALVELRTFRTEAKVAVFAHDCFNSFFLWAYLGRGALTEADRYRQDECCVNVLEDGKEPVINMRVI